MKIKETDSQKQTSAFGSDRVVIGADLGGTHLRAATVDGQGRIHERTKQRTPRDERAEEIVRALVSAARKFEQRSRERGQTISALSVAVPGTVQTESGVVMKAPNLPSLNGFRLGAALTSELDWPVVVENDVNAAAVGEAWQGAARGFGTSICIMLGTGVGGGVILNNELWRGIDGTGGEIGHITVEPLGAPCGCGNRGCVEVYGSATAIVRMTRELSPRYPQSRLPASEQLTAEEVYKSGLAGDELALEVFRRVGVYLGIALGGLINVLNPEVIVIGGGAAGGWELFIEHLHSEVAARAFAVPAKRAQIVRAECGDDAGILGAAHLAFTSSDKAV